MVATLPPLALTQGDPAGIGLELALMLWREQPAAPFLFIGSRAHLAARAARLGWDVALQNATPADAGAVFETALPVLDPGDDGIASEAGRPDPATAAGTIRAIDMAVALARSGDVRAVVTNPIAKSVLHASGFGFPGHTEYLAHLCRVENQPAPRPVMLIWSPLLAVVPVTIHVPLADVPSLLTRDLICGTIRTAARDLASRFGISQPRIAVAGLNPHAGEAGSIGQEDLTVIAPALQLLRAEGLDVRGPLPADTMFHATARANYDVAVTMYHDQGLIPAKTLAFDDGVNVTLGLPIIRTSPDHGTAFDIAGRGMARPDSLRAALALADRLSRPHVSTPSVRAS